MTSIENKLQMDLITKQIMERISLFRNSENEQEKKVLQAEIDALHNQFEVLSSKEKRITMTSKIVQARIKQHKATLPNYNVKECSNWQGWLLFLIGVAVVCFSTCHSNLSLR